MGWEAKLREAVAGLGHDPAEALRLLRIGLATFRFRYILRAAGPGSVFGTHNRIINAANVSIGRGCLFQDSIYVRAGVHGRVEIGDRVAINSFVQIYGHGGVTLGEETQLGPGTIITTTGHDYRDAGLEAQFTPITIGRRVWIGANVTVIGGVTIGDGAVIGAGAVVVRDVPPRTLAVGVPARVIRHLDETDSQPAAARPTPPTEESPARRERYVAERQTAASRGTAAVTRIDGG